MSDDKSIELEPAVIWWHKGKLQVAIDILKSMVPIYNKKKVCDCFEDAIILLINADAQLSIMAEEANQKLFEEAMGD